MADNIRRIPFVKMHGCGNDYIYIEADAADSCSLSQLAKGISDRHFGIGSDGLVAITPSDIADFRMRMFNSDGSEAQMCGNASRCIAKYVFERGLTSKTTFTLETGAGIKTLTVNTDSDGKVASITVNMGVPTFLPSEIPASSTTNSPIIESEVRIADNFLKITAVGIGNPHGVCFVGESNTLDSDPLDDDLVLKAGPALEIHPMWPEKANIEFAQVLNRKEIRMRVWERGAGETMACGTGACATAAAAMKLGLTDSEVIMHLRGGDLLITLDPDTGELLMTGPATFIAEGIYFFNPDRMESLKF